MTRLATSVALALLASGCFRSPTVDRDEVIGTIRSSDRALQQAISARDLDRITAFYAKDALLLPAAEPMIRGQPAIAQEWKRILAIPGFASDSAILRVDLSSGNDLAYAVGTYRARMVGEDDRPVIEQGKWLTVWKKQPDDRWLIVAETYNTDTPPPDHK